MPRLDPDRAKRRPLLLCLALGLGGCSSDLSPCARTATSGAQPGHAVELWIDCKNEEAGQLTEVRVTSSAPAPDAGVDAGASADPSDVWWVSSPVDDATDYFFVAYGVVPRGWDERRPALTLSPGARYRAALVTSDYGTLEFDFTAP